MSIFSTNAQNVIGDDGSVLLFASFIGNGWDCDLVEDWTDGEGI